MTAQLDLGNILTQHALWVTNPASGARADLAHANLTRANLTRANLKDANLAFANLEGVYLDYINLEGANLKGANLGGANLARANLKRANLAFANLRNANLEGANLECANLEGSHLAFANLRGANLEGAYLKGAYLAGANLEGANLPAFQLPAGRLVVWKKACQALIKLEVGADVARTASLIGNKCRSQSALVLDILPWPLVSNADSMTQAPSLRDNTTIYKVGERVVADSYDPDPRVECTHGIHWFTTREEAEAYD